MRSIEEYKQDPYPDTDSSRPVSLDYETEQKMEPTVPVRDFADNRFYCRICNEQFPVPKQYGEWITCPYCEAQVHTENSGLTRPKSVDTIVDPPHYACKSPEPIDVISAWGLDYLEGNVLKYLARWRDKNGVEDLRKAEQYIRLLINREEQSSQR